MSGQYETSSQQQSEQVGVSEVLTVSLCLCTGVLQLPASGNLPADDWSAVAGRGPGQSGSFHAAAARPVWLLSVSLP